MFTKMLSILNKKPETLYTAVAEQKEYSISAITFDLKDMEELYAFFIKGAYGLQIKKGLTKSQSIAVAVHDVLCSEKHRNKREEIYLNYQNKRNKEYLKILKDLLDAGQKKQLRIRHLMQLEQKEQNNKAYSHDFKDFLNARKLYDLECSKSVLEYLNNSTEVVENVLERYEQEHKSEKKIQVILKV